MSGGKPGAARTRTCWAAAWTSIFCVNATAWAAMPIQHVIIIMQENRSFDHYFGTYPGANGYPKNTCEPINPADPGEGCVAPFHDQNDINAGGPHGAVNAQADLDDGITVTKSDGFVQSQVKGNERSCVASAAPAAQLRHCGARRRDPRRDGLP